MERRVVDAYGETDSHAAESVRTDGLHRDRGHLYVLDILDVFAARKA